MSALSDDAIRKVFVELQAKYVASSQQVNVVKSQIQTTQRERKMAELTRRELDTLGNDTKAYKPVGKMFLQAPLGEMKKHYVDVVAQSDEKIQQLEKSQKYWERAASDAQSNLKDILHGPRTM
ncbi:Prefoldin [Radiomyces spectabilis]|uniref:Prefoldin n=1 Tax=Radiomyces spectabilis TaxID=64574 RepID=UPI00221FFC7F|nr:Prefoldin [Radiomyces spectabilis]KAI8384316.1 Prefoldin [Radiomyces spectabilis]